MQSLSYTLSDIFITGGNGHETDETCISVVVSVAMMVAMLFVVPVQAAGNYVAQLYGKVTDAGQVVNKVVLTTVMV